MSKREYILRYFSIIKFLRNRREASWKEIDDYLKSESEFHGYNLNISQRTFQRDLNDIRSLWNIDIQYDFSRQRYFIADDASGDELSSRMMEAFELFNVLKASDGFSQHILFETRKPQGLEHFYGLLHAIKNRFIIRFAYQKFWEDESTQRIAEPYSLKEFKGRWYILAKDQRDAKIKTFGLDRISRLEITKKKYEFPKNFNTNEMFHSCFGIICPEDEQPQEVILSFEPTQGKYIKTFPLHTSQKILTDNEKELRIQLKLYLTYDFTMELLSHGETVKIISPKKLEKEICKIYATALKQYAERT